MATTLLERWLEHHDPIHDGWTPAGIANGVTMDPGCPHFCRPAGGYNLYRGTTRASIDYDHPVGAAGADAETITPFPWVEHEPDQSYFYACVAIGGGGQEAIANDATPAIVRVRIDDEGEPIPVRPARPRDLTVSLLAGGKFKLRWSYVPALNGVRLAAFRVYGDAGTGTMDWNTPVATVAARLSQLGAGNYSWESTGFAHEQTVQWAARAVNFDASRWTNSKVASGVADAVGPAAHAVTGAAIGEDE